MPRGAPLYEIREHAPREGAGQDPGKVEDANLCQGELHGGLDPQDPAGEVREPSAGMVGLAVPRKL